MGGRAPLQTVILKILGLQRGVAQLGRAQRSGR